MRYEEGRPRQDRPLANNTPDATDRTAPVRGRHAITAEQRQALDIARSLVKAGVPVFIAQRDDTQDTGYRLPSKWHTSTPTLDVVDLWRPGWALCALMGTATDLIDVDPRNGGDASAAGWKAGGLWPRSYGRAATPSGGTHDLIATLGVGSRDNVAPGIDIKGGKEDGTGRGFAFIAPTERISKTTGRREPYRWLVEPDTVALAEGGDDTGAALADLVSAAKAKTRAAVDTTPSGNDVLMRDPAHAGPIPDGSRHAALVSYAGRLRNLRITYAEAQALMLTRWRDCAQPPAARHPLTEAEALDKLRDVWERYPTAIATAVDEDGAADGTGSAEVDGGGSDQAQPPARATPLNWRTFLDADLDAVDFLAGRLMVRGEHIALIGDGKAGKSVFALEWAWRMAAGLPFLGDEPREPLRVMYVDHENGHDEIQERLLSLGATADTLTNLIYLSFPLFRPLNTEAGAADLLGAVDHHVPDVLFFDTISRMVRGKENESDPWLDLYRYTLLPLKARKKSSARLDHFGKDATRGGRGNSAKTQDVDGVWELVPTERGSTLLRLTRTHTRSGKGHSDLLIRRHGELIGDRWKAGGTWHGIADETERPDTTPDPMKKFRPAARRVHGILSATPDTGLTVRQIGDELAAQADGGPLKARTIQDALRTLADAGMAEECPTAGGASLWTVR